MLACLDKSIIAKKILNTFNPLRRRIYLPEGHFEDSNQSQKLYMYQQQLS